MSEIAKRLFISYAWENEDYRIWVRRLAARFREDGVDARLDYWHLRGNDSLPEFMNREVRQADWVLVLCSPAYRSKVHATEDGIRSTGVGWEAMLLTSRLFTTSENKMLAALARGPWTEAAPDFLLGHVYVDLSDAKTFEANFKTLLQRITGTSEKAPPLGELPKDLEDAPLEPLRGHQAAEATPVPSPTDDSADAPMSVGSPALESPVTSSQTRLRMANRWLFTGAFGIFLLLVFCFAPPVLPPFKQRILGLASAILAGTCASLWAGSLDIQWQWLTSRLGKMAVRGGGGFAVFSLVIFLWWMPASAPVKDAKEITEEVVKVGGRVHIAGGDLLDKAIQAVATDYHLKPGDVSKAPQAWTPETPYERAMQAFASGKYEDASRLLEAAIKDPGTAGAEVGDIAKLLGECLLAEGRYSEAAETFQKALARQPDDPVLLNKIGLSLFLAGNYQGANSSFQQVLALKSVSAGVDYKQGLYAKLYIAQILLIQGKPEEAFKRGEEILLEMNRVFGKKAPETLTTQNLLCTIRQNHGNLAEAHECWEKLLVMCRETFGEQDSQTLAVMNNLSLNMFDQGEYEEARNLQEKIVSGWKGALGTSHPFVLTAETNLARTLSAEGKLLKAYTLQKPVLESLRHNPGNEHIDTLAAMETLANILRKRGDLDEARALYQEDLNIRRRIDGPKNLNAINVQALLALTLRDQGNLAAARGHQKEVLDSISRRFPKDHLSTLAAKDDLAVTLMMQGDLPSARKLAEEALAGRRQKLGNKHPRTLVSMDHLASILMAQHDFNGARDLLEFVVKERRSNRNLGPHHPDTSTAERALASVFEKLGNAEAAQQYYNSLQWLSSANPDDLTKEQREIAAALPALLTGAPK